MKNNNITISGHHIEVTPTLKLNITNMVNKLQEKSNHITNVHVTLKVDSINQHLHHAEAEVCLSGKKEPIFAKSSSKDMYESIHKLTTKLNRQIIKYKEIIKNHTDHHNHCCNHHHISKFGNTSDRL